MSELSLVLPEINKPDKTEDPKIVAALTTIQTWGNGNIGEENIEAHKALYATNNVYSAPAGFNANEKITPSASRMSFIAIFLQSNKAYQSAVLVGGITITVIERTKAGEGESDTRACTFLVPPGLTFEVKQNTGTIELARYSRLLL